MKKLIFIISFIACFACEGICSTKGIQLEKYKRIVIYGDSITDNQLYPLLLETFIRTRFPDNHNDFWNRGWGGDQAKNIKRFERDCLSLNPDLIMINLGMNDAGYIPEISERLLKYSSNIKRMVKCARDKNPNIKLMLLSPVMYESEVRENRYFYPYNLWKVSRELGKVAHELNTSYINLNTLYTNSTGLIKRLFPDSIVFSRDGIHPNKIGQCIIAINILQATGPYPCLSNLEIDVANNKILKSEGAVVKIVKHSDTVLVFDRKLYRLPLPVLKEFHKFAPFLNLEKINNDILKLTGLKPGFYSIECSGQILGIFSAQTLRKGINFAMLFNSPDYIQAAKVLDTVKEKQDLQFFLWRKQQTLKDGLFPHGKSIPENAASLKQYYNVISRAKQKIYSVNKPKWHRFILRKSNEKPSLEKHVAVTAGIVPVGKSYSTPQAVKLELKNLTNKQQKVKLNLPENIKAAQTQFTLSSLGNKTIALKALCKTEDARPLIQISYKPQDDSFPLIKEHIRLRLKPHLKIFNATNPGNKQTIVLDESKLPHETKINWTGPEDLRAKAYLSWDEKDFSFIIEVNDQYHTNRYTGSRVHQDDNIQLAFYFPTKKRHLEYGLTLTQNGPEVYCWRGPKRGLSPNVCLDVKRVKNKIIYKAAFPWKELRGKKPEKGFRFAFSFGVNDRDANGKWKYLPWTEGIWYGKNPNNFGMLELAE